MKLYHGTQVQNIKQLNPFATRGNAISKPVICFTPNCCIALLYIWNRSYKWITFSENENGKVVFTEHYENMLYDFYNKVSGSIYECDGDNPSIIPTHMKGIYTSEVPVPVEKETRVYNLKPRFFQTYRTSFSLPVVDKECVRPKIKLNAWVLT